MAAIFDPECVCQPDTATCPRGLVGRLRELCSGRCPPERPCSADQVQRYRAQFARQAGVRLRSDLRPDCRYLGEPTGEVRECPACRGKVRLKVFACAHSSHAEGTTRTGCQTCPDYRVPPNPRAVRHLLYHVLPVAGNGTWQRNLDQLLARIGHFNGRRVMAISTRRGEQGPPLDPPDAVREYLQGHDVETFSRPNDPKLREVATWKALWARVPWTDDPYHSVFYAHAKGVTHPVNPGVTVHRWATLQYETCLDYLPLVDAALERFPIAGSFLRHYPLAGSTWHYSGAFFWVRLRDATSERVRMVPRTWCGNEAWPGQHWPVDQAATLFSEGGDGL